MIRLKINIYASLDQKFPEVEINHPHNIELINLFFKKLESLWRIQKHQKDGYNIKFYTLEDLKNSNKDNDVILNI